MPEKRKVGRVAPTYLIRARMRVRTSSARMGPVLVGVAASGATPEGRRGTLGGGLRGYSGAPATVRAVTTATSQRLPNIPGLPDGGFG
jgi:hypothetical protein